MVHDLGQLFCFLYSPPFFVEFFSILTYHLTSVLTADIIPMIQDMQLFTTAHHEGSLAGDAVGIVLVRYYHPDERRCDGTLG